MAACIGFASVYGPRRRPLGSSTNWAFPYVVGTSFNASKVGASSDGPKPGTYVGSTIVWQRWQVTPSRSGLVSAAPVGSAACPEGIDAGTWHRKQYVPTPGASWFAVASCAKKRGSRPPIDMRLADHVL